MFGLNLLINAKTKEQYGGALTMLGLSDNVTSEEDVVCSDEICEAKKKIKDTVGDMVDHVLADADDVELRAMADQLDEGDVKNIFIDNLGITANVTCYDENGAPNFSPEKPMDHRFHQLDLDKKDGQE